MHSFSRAPQDIFPPNISAVRPPRVLDRRSALWPRLFALAVLPLLLQVAFGPFRGVSEPQAWVRSSLPLNPGPHIPSEPAPAAPQAEGESGAAASSRETGILRMASMPGAAVPAAQAPAQAARDVVDLQRYRSRQSLANTRGDTVTLTNLNPDFGAWYLLEWQLDGQHAQFHLEVAARDGHPERRPALALHADGLTLAMPGEAPRLYPLWAPAQAGDTPPGALNEAPAPVEVFRPDFKSKSPYIPLCDGQVFVRRQQPGSSTGLEYTTDLLRSTSLGTWFVEAAKPYLIPAPERGDERHEAPAQAPHAEDAAYPLNAELNPKLADVLCKNRNLGIESEAAGEYRYGKWYKTTRHPGVFVSVMKPSAVSPAILDSHRDRVSALGMHDKNRKEAEGLVYLMALDMAAFRFGYSLGAEHPRVDWSGYAQGERNADGPDGFGTLKPLCTAGALAPYYLPYVSATFVGGFKREHSAFKRGPFSKVNRGSHYGFGENGVVCSVPRPGLATAAINASGDLELFTWPEADAGLGQCYPHFRQNGLPIIEALGADGASIPGAYCNNWFVAQWSGDQHGNVVTLRSGLGIQSVQGRRYLLFAHFSGATPSAMARVFQAYRVSYAMQLDMNTPNYCFASLYHRDAQGAIQGAEYLHEDMRSGNGSDHSLKFIQRNDTRDFFYVLQRF